MIRKRDLELTKAEQTPEAHAFMFKRTDEKLHHLELIATQFAESKTGSVRDRLEAMRFLLQRHDIITSVKNYCPHASNHVSSSDWSRIPLLLLLWFSISWYFSYMLGCRQ